MTDEELQRSLDRIAKLSNKLQSEAERRFGRTGMLFFESSGRFHIMDGDATQSQGFAERQSHIKFSSSVISRMSAGAW